jgi:hypothetical protein
MGSPFCMFPIFLILFKEIGLATYPIAPMCYGFRITLKGLDVNVLPFICWFDLHPIDASVPHIDT